MKSRVYPSPDWRIIVACAAGFGIRTASGQVATNVSVNFNSPITYAGGAAVATMPSTGLGLGTSVYAGQWGNSALPNLINAAGTQMVRYPGGSYSDIYNWSLGTANEGGYVAPNSSIGNYFKVLDQSGAQGIITVNYGSNTTATMGAPPQEAAAEVAYADASAAVYGTTSDVTLGSDAAGVNWETGGFWAKLRASTPAQYQAWATAAGDYNPAYSFLAINHPAPENIQYWEIGNEIGGNGYSGIQWEYDLHAPYSQGNTSSNVGRKNNPLLSPTAYAQNLNQFATLMKEVDPNIQIGAGFSAAPNDPGDKAILQTAGNNIDFGIIHWYPTGSVPAMTYSGSGSLPTEITNLRNSVKANTTKGANGLQITVTEFADGNSSPPLIQNALFVADAYATGLENGVKNMDFQEMSSSTFLGGSSGVTPEVVYYASQMVSDFVSSGDTFVSTSYSDSSLRVHAVEKPDGSIALLFINDGTGSAQDRSLTINLSNPYPLGGNGTLYLYGNANISGSNTTAPTSQALTNLGSSISLTIPNQTMATLIVPAVQLTWNNAGGSGNGVNWDASSQNWNNGSAPSAFANNVNVAFTDTNNAHYAVTLNSAVTAHLVTINNSSGDYVISGAGSIAGGASVTKMGGRSATLDTVNTYTGETTVNAGTLVIGVNGALPNGAVNITGGTLQLGAGTGVATITSLAVSGNGALDLTNNKIILNYGSNANDPVTAIAAALTSGYNAGAWTGAGITSSSAAINPSKFAVGYLDGNRAADSVGGHVAANQLILKYTLAGDAFLENSVGFDDLVVVAQNFGKTGEDWAGGNFNYDPAGSVGFADLTSVAQNFGFSSGVNLDVSGGISPAWLTGRASVQSTAVNPEPATAALLAIWAAGMLGRRKRTGAKS